MVSFVILHVNSRLQHFADKEKSIFLQRSVWKSGK